MGRIISPNNWPRLKRNRGLNIRALSDMWIRTDGTDWTLDGSNNVQTITDKSIVGTHSASQATSGSRPASTALLNGIKGAQGNGSSAFLDISLTIASTRNTIALVSSVSTTTQACLLANTGGFGFFSRNSFFASSAALAWANAADVQTFLAAGPTSGAHIMLVTQIDGTSLVGYLDGTQVFSVVPGVALNGKTFVKILSRVGDFFASSGFWEFIHIADVASSLTSGLHSYLKPRYAL